MQTLSTFIHNQFSSLQTQIMSAKETEQDKKDRLIKSLSEGPWQLTQAQLEDVFSSECLGRKLLERLMKASEVLGNLPWSDVLVQLKDHRDQRVRGEISARGVSRNILWAITDIDNTERYLQGSSPDPIQIDDTHKRKRSSKPSMNHMTTSSRDDDEEDVSNLISNNHTPSSQLLHESRQPNHTASLTNVVLDKCLKFLNTDRVCVVDACNSIDKLEEHLDQVRRKTYVILPVVCDAARWALATFDLNEGVVTYHDSGNEQHDSIQQNLSALRNVIQIINTALGASLKKEPIYQQMLEVSRDQSGIYVVLTAYHFASGRSVPDRSGRPMFSKPYLAAWHEAFHSIEDDLPSDLETIKFLLSGSMCTVKSTQNSESLNERRIRLQHAEEDLLHARQIYQHLLQTQAEAKCRIQQEIQHSKELLALSHNLPQMHGLQDAVVDAETLITANKCILGSMEESQEGLRRIGGVFAEFSTFLQEQFTELLADVGAEVEVLRTAAGVSAQKYANAELQLEEILKQLEDTEAKKMADERMLNQTLELRRRLLLRKVTKEA